MRLQNLTGLKAFDSGFIGLGVSTGPGNDRLPDGTDLGFGSLAGNVFANTNGGDLVEINLTTGGQTVVATGPSRGDLVAIDPSNYGLLATETSEIDRITAAGGGFGPLTAAPEPSSWLLHTTGVLDLFGHYRRTRRHIRA